jgi:predicted NAD/FAD-dependent oxidoreductase
MIVQMSNIWSKEHLELSREEVTDLILNEIKPFGPDWLEEADVHAHRWRFARPMHQPDRRHHQRITFAGDAWASPVGTIEASLKSAEFAALELIWKLHSAKEKKPISMQTTLF